MRYNTIGLLSVLAAGSVQLVANDIEPGKEYYNATLMPKAIVIDGNFSEWAGVPVLADPKYAIPKGAGTKGTYVLFEEYSGGIWTGPDDQTSAVQVAWDADNLYIGMVVTDDYHENSANSAWNGDSAQLMIANGARTTQVALYNYALGGVEDALGDVIVNHEAGPAADAGCGCETEAIVKRDIVKKKTYYEIKMPAAAVGLTAPLKAGMQVGLGMAINDGDETLPGQAAQGGQKGWGGLGAHSIVFGKTPAQTALLTLTTNLPTKDLVFFSAANPGMDFFTFRVNDKGASIVDPATVKLTIDGQAVTLTSTAKVGDAIDFAYKSTTLFSANVEHQYTIEMKDTAGNVSKTDGVFKFSYAVLAKAQQAVSVDKTKPGFVVKVFQNESYLPNTLAEAELALKGQLTNTDGTLLENWADPSVTGPALAAGVKDGALYRFEIPTVINLSQSEGESNGNFTPDEQLPGIPGVNGSNDGFDVEITTFVDLPAGMLTMGVVSDDSFRAQAGYINVPANASLLSEMDGTTANVTFKFLVQDAGIYPLRVVWQEAGGGAHLELFSVAADGTRALIGDSANGGYKAYRSGVVPSKPVNFSLGAQIAAGKIEISWTESGVVLQQSTDLKTWTDVANATSPFRPSVTGTATGFYRLKK